MSATAMILAGPAPNPAPRGNASAAWRCGGLRGDAGELLGGCVPAEGLAGAGVEFGGDRGDPLGAVDAQIGALRKVLAQQPVGVLVARSLPRAGLLAEEHRHRERAGDLRVQRHLLA